MKLWHHPSWICTVLKMLLIKWTYLASWRRVVEHLASCGLEITYCMKAAYWGLLLGGSGTNEDWFTCILVSCQISVNIASCTLFVIVSTVYSILDMWVLFCAYVNSYIMYLKHWLTLIYIYIYISRFMKWQVLACICDTNVQHEIVHLVMSLH